MTTTYDEPEIPTWEQTRWMANVWDTAIGQIAAPDPATEPMMMYRQLRTKRWIMEQSALQQPMLRLYDGSMNYIANLTGELSGSVEELMADSGKANVVIRYDNWLGDYIINQTADYEDLHLVMDPIPTAPTWQTRWGGKITGLVGKKDDKGLHTIEIEAISNREHAKKLLFGANPFFAPEVQLPKMWVLPGNTRTILAMTMFINLARIFWPGLAIPTNIFNPGAWLGTYSNVYNLDPLSWPLQVLFVDAALDQSRTTALGATWTDWHSTMDPLLTDAGVIFRAYTYLTTDTVCPNTELVNAAEGVVDLLGLGELDQSIEELASPNRNCICFSLEDMSGQTGPTGTAADGLLSLMSVTLDDLITPFTINLDTQQTLNGEPIEDVMDEDQTTLFEQLTDTAPAPPQVIWWDGQFTGILDSARIMRKGPVKTAMTGGKSPSLVNEAQTFAIKYALSQLQIVITSGIISEGGAAPIGAGLDNLYQGQLDNVLFAWERYTDPLRALYSGDCAFNEVFEKGSGTAYTLAGILTLRVANWKTRSWQGFTCHVMNGHPWLLDVDVRLGQRAGFEQEQIIFVDQIHSLKRVWDRKTPAICTMTIGEGGERQDPFGAAFRILGAAWATLGQFLGEGTIFG
jgi:hypothetical protein